MISSGIGAILSAEGERDRPTAAIVTQFLGVQLRSGQIGILLRYAKCEWPLATCVHLDPKGQGNTVRKHLSACACAFSFSQGCRSGF